MDSFWALRLSFITLGHINRAFSRARKLRNVNSLARPSSFTERIGTSTGCPPPSPLPSPRHKTVSEAHFAGRIIRAELARRFSGCFHGSRAGLG